jgi:hypothetical protein
MPSFTISMMDTRSEDRDRAGGRAECRQVNGSFRRHHALGLSRFTVSPCRDRSNGRPCSCEAGGSRKPSAIVAGQTDRRGDLAPGPIVTGRASPMMRLPHSNGSALLSAKFFSRGRPSAIRDEGRTIDPRPGFPYWSVKIAFGIIPWMPLVPSTTCVT